MNTHLHQPVFSLSKDMNFLWLVGFVCLSVSAVNTQSDIFHMGKQDQRRKFCGSFLANTLSLVCRGRYNEWLNNSKKDVAFGEMSGDDYAYEQSQEEPSWPFLSQQNAASFLGTGSGGSSGGRIAYGHYRYRRGIYDECCKKTCSLKELQNYCGV
ncbi:LIRP-like [Arctopsyche grandis]|uniref:LIRP-like n=1 Tax=Arctopsyche grandis TaxID=121162 RepID=UPI00406D9CBA